jgi:alkylation response protein AidB-like acyl-CoA dehydrogenase
MTTNNSENRPYLQTLPGDDVRQVMWRFSDRYEIQMLVQSTRQVARGPVAHLVAEGGRNTHEWTEGKAALLKVYDESGITSAFLEPKYGGVVEGPKNLAMALVAYELAWVDGGAATASLAGNLGLAPIHERGTQEQQDKYMNEAFPPAPGDNRKHVRVAFALTEPLPYAGVETGLLCGKVRVAEWKEGQEPILEVDKRGRFITNMDYANVVTAAVDTDDKRIKSSCMIILEEGDPGVFDRGAVTKKMVHQLSSTRDPIFNMRVPASRIIGGYTVKDGVIIPNFSHGDVIEAVFKRTRVTVGLMTAAKLLSAVEPVIRYQRTRFRGSAQATAGTPRYDLGIQSKQDAQQRLVDVWATGEATASLGFSTERLFDELDPLEIESKKTLADRGVKGGRAMIKAMAAIDEQAIELLQLERLPVGQRDEAKIAALKADKLVRYSLLESAANVLCPAIKLWGTGVGATMLREAVSMMGGYGITEDCPGFLGNKWMDAQLEATYEGPEAVQRRQLSVTMTHPVFIAQLKGWTADLEAIAKTKPETGASVVAEAMKQWLWTLEYLQANTDANGAKLYHSNRQGLTFSLADALCWLLAAQHLILDILELEEKGPQNPTLAEGLPGLVAFMSDLAYVQSARSAGESSRVCSELVFGYQTPETVKAGAVAPFLQMQAKVTVGMAGSRLAKDHAGESLTKVMIPEALDYPL